MGDRLGTAGVVGFHFLISSCGKVILNKGPLLYSGELQSFALTRGHVN